MMQENNAWDPLKGATIGGARGNRSLSNTASGRHQQALAEQEARKAGLDPNNPLSGRPGLEKDAAAWDKYKKEYEEALVVPSELRTMMYANGNSANSYFQDEQFSEIIQRAEKKARAKRLSIVDEGSVDEAIAELNAEIDRNNAANPNNAREKYFNIPEDKQDKESAYAYLLGNAIRRYDKAVSLDALKKLHKLPRNVGPNKSKRTEPPPSTSPAELSDIFPKVVPDDSRTKLGPLSPEARKASMLSINTTGSSVVAQEAELTPDQRQAANRQNADVQRQAMEKQALQEAYGSKTALPVQYNQESKSIDIGNLEQADKDLEIEFVTKYAAALMEDAAKRGDKEMTMAVAKSIAQQLNQYSADYNEDAGLADYVGGMFSGNFRNDLLADLIPYMDDNYEARGGQPSLRELFEDYKTKKQQIKELRGAKSAYGEKLPLQLFAKTDNPFDKRTVSNAAFSFVKGLTGVLGSGIKQTIEALQGLDIASTSPDQLGYNDSNPILGREQVRKAAENVAKGTGSTPTLAELRSILTSTVQPEQAKALKQMEFDRPSVADEAMSTIAGFAGSMLGRTGSLNVASGSMARASAMIQQSKPIQDALAKSPQIQAMAQAVAGSRFGQDAIQTVGTFALSHILERAPNMTSDDLLNSIASGVIFAGIGTVAGEVAMGIASRNASYQKLLQNPVFRKHLDEVSGGPAAATLEGRLAQQKDLMYALSAVLANPVQSAANTAFQGQEYTAGMFIADMFIGPAMAMKMKADIKRNGGMVPLDATYYVAHAQALELAKDADAHARYAERNTGSNESIKADQSETQRKEQTAGNEVENEVDPGLQDIDSAVNQEFNKDDLAANTEDYVPRSEELDYAEFIEQMELAKKPEANNSKLASQEPEYEVTTFGERRSQLQDFETKLDEQQSFIHNLLKDKVSDYKVVYYSGSTLYDAATRTIMVNRGIKGTPLETNALLHEGTHAISHKLIEDDPAFARDLEKLAKNVLNSAWFKKWAESGNHVQAGYMAGSLHEFFVGFVDNVNGIGDLIVKRSKSTGAKLGMLMASVTGDGAQVSPADALQQFRSMAERAASTPDVIAGESTQQQFQFDTDIPKFVEAYMNGTLERTPENLQYEIDNAAEIEKEFKRVYAAREAAIAATERASKPIDENTPLGETYSLYRDVSSLAKIKDIKDKEERRMMAGPINAFIKNMGRLGIADEIALAHFSENILEVNPELNNMAPQDRVAKLVEFSERLINGAEPELVKMMRGQTKAMLTETAKQELIDKNDEGYEKFYKNPFNKEAAAKIVGIDKVGDLDGMLMGMIKEPKKMEEYLVEKAVAYASSRTQDQDVIDAAVSKAKQFALEYVINNHNTVDIVPLVIGSEKRGENTVLYVGNGSNLTHDQSSGARLTRKMQKPTALYNGLARVATDMLFPQSNPTKKIYPHLTGDHKTLINHLTTGKIGNVTNSKKLKDAIYNDVTVADHVIERGRFLFAKGYEGNIFFEIHPDLHKYLNTPNIAERHSRIRKTIKQLEELDITHFLGSENLWGVGASDIIEPTMKAFDLWELVDRARNGMLIAENESIAPMLRPELANNKDWQEANRKNKPEMIARANEVITRLSERFKRNELDGGVPILHKVAADADKKAQKGDAKVEWSDNMHKQLLADALNVFYNKVVDHGNSNEVLAHPKTGKRGKHAMKYAGVQLGNSYTRFADVATMQGVLDIVGKYQRPLDLSNVKENEVEAVQQYWRDKGIVVPKDGPPKLRQFVMTDMWAEANPEIWMSMSGQLPDEPILPPSKWHDGASWLINPETHKFLASINGADPEITGNIKYAFGGSHIYKSEYAPLYQTGNLLVDEFLQQLKNQGVAAIATQSTIKSKSHTMPRKQGEIGETLVYDYDGTLHQIDVNGKPKTLNKEELLSRYANLAVAPEHVHEYDLAGDNALANVSVTQLNEKTNNLSFGLDDTPYTAFGQEPRINKAMATLMHNKASEWGRSYRAFNNIYGGAKVNSNGLLEDRNTVKFVEKLIDKVRKDEDLSNFVGDPAKKEQIVRALENALTDGTQVDIAAIRAIDAIYPGILTNAIGAKPTLAQNMMSDEWDAGVKSTTFGRSTRLAPYVPKANHISNLLSHYEKWKRIELAEKAQWINQTGITGKVNVADYVEENIAAELDSYINGTMQDIANNHYVNGTAMHPKSNGIVISMKELDAQNEKIRQLRAKGHDIDYLYGGSQTIMKLNPSDAITSWSPSNIIGIDTDMNAGVMMNPRFAIMELGRDHDGDNMSMLFPHPDWENDPQDNTDNPALIDLVSEYREASKNTSGRPGSNFSNLHEALTEAGAAERDPFKMEAEDNVSKSKSFKVYGPGGKVEKNIIRVDPRTISEYGMLKTMDVSGMAEGSIGSGIALINNWYEIARGRKWELGKDYTLSNNKINFVVSNDAAMLKTNDAYYKQSQYDRYGYAPYVPEEIFFRSRVKSVGIEFRTGNEELYDEVQIYNETGEVGPLLWESFVNVVNDATTGKFGPEHFMAMDAKHDLQSRAGEYNRVFKGLGYGQRETLRQDIADVARGTSESELPEQMLAEYGTEDMGIDLRNKPLRTGGVKLIGLPRTPDFVLARDQAKADKATKFIGKSGYKNSLTDSYRKSFAQQGRANVRNYAKDDVVFVSTDGGAKPGPPLYDLIDNALKAHATFITDDLENRERLYNSGERAVAKFLEAKGYVEEQQSGVWKPGPDAPYIPDQWLNTKTQQDIIQKTIKGAIKVSKDRLRKMEQGLSGDNDFDAKLGSTTTRMVRAMMSFEDGNSNHANLDPFYGMQRNAALWTPETLQQPEFQAMVHEYFSGARVRKGAESEIPITDNIKWQLTQRGIHISTPDMNVDAKDIVSASGWHPVINDLLTQGVPLKTIFPSDIMGKVQAIDILSARQDAPINSTNLATVLRDNPNIAVVRLSHMQNPYRDHAVTKDKMVSFDGATKKFVPSPEYKNLNLIWAHQKSDSELKYEIINAVKANIDAGREVIIDRNTLGVSGRPLYVQQDLLHLGAKVLPNRTYTDLKRSRLEGKIAGFLDPQTGYLQSFMPKEVKSGDDILARPDRDIAQFHAGLTEVGANTLTPENVDFVDDIVYNVAKIQEVDRQAPYSDEAGKPLEEREGAVFGLFDGKLNKINGIKWGQGKAGAMNRLNKFVGRPIHTLSNDEAETIVGTIQEWARSEFPDAANIDQLVDGIGSLLNPMGVYKQQMEKWNDIERDHGPVAAQAARYNYFFSLMNSVYDMMEAQGKRGNLKDKLALWSPLAGQSTMDVLEHFANDKALLNGMTQTHAIVNVDYNNGAEKITVQPVTLADNRNLVVDPGRPDVRYTSETRTRHSYAFQHLNRLKDSMGSVVSSWREETRKLFPEGTPFTEPAQRGAISLLEGNNNPFYRMVDVPIEYVENPETGEMVPTGGGQREEPAIREWQDEWFAKYENDAMPMVGVTITGADGVPVRFDTSVEHGGLFSPESLNAMVRMMMPGNEYSLKPGMNRLEIESALKWAITAKAFNTRLATYQRSYAEVLKEYGRSLARNNYRTDSDIDVQIHNEAIDAGFADVQMQIATFANDMMKESAARFQSSLSDNINSMSYVNYDEFVPRVSSAIRDYPEIKNKYLKASKKWNDSMKGGDGQSSMHLEAMKELEDDYNYYTQNLASLGAKLGLDVNNKTFGIVAGDALADLTYRHLQRRLREANRMNRQLSRTQTFFERMLLPDTTERSAGIFDPGDGKIMEHFAGEAPNYSPDMIFRRNKETVDNITNKVTSIFQNAYTTEKQIRKNSNKTYLASGIAEDNFVADISNESTIYRKRIDVDSPVGIKKMLEKAGVDEGRNYLMPEEIGVPLATPVAITFRSSDGNERRTMTGRIAGVVRLPNTVVLTGELKQRVADMRKEIDRVYEYMGGDENPFADMDPQIIQYKNRIKQAESFMNTNDAKKGMKDFVVMYNQEARTLNYIDAATITNAVAGEEQGYKGRVLQSNRTKRLAQAFEGADKLGEFLAGDLMVQTIKRMGHDYETGGEFVVGSEMLTDKRTGESTKKNIAFFGKVGSEDIPTGYANLIDKMAAITNFSSSYMHGYGKEAIGLLASVPLMAFNPIAGINSAAIALGSAGVKFLRNYVGNTRGFATRTMGVSNLYTPGDVLRNFGSVPDKPVEGSAIASTAARRIDRGVGLDSQIRAIQREALNPNQETLPLQRQYNELMKIKKHYDGLGRVLTDSDLAGIVGTIESMVHLKDRVLATIREGQLSLALYGKGPDGVQEMYLRNLSELMEANLDALNSAIVGVATFGKFSMKFQPEEGWANLGMMNPVVGLARLNNNRIKLYMAQGRQEERSVSNTATASNIVYDRLNAGTAAASNDVLRASFANAMIDVINGKFDQRALHLRSPLGRAITLFSQYSQNYNRKVIFGPQQEQQYWQAFMNGLAEDPGFRSALVNKYGAKIAGELVPSVFLGTERIEAPFTKFDEEGNVKMGALGGAIAGNTNPFSTGGAMGRGLSVGLASTGIYFLFTTMAGMMGEKSKNLVESMLDQAGGSMSALATAITGFAAILTSTAMNQAGILTDKQQQMMVAGGMNDFTRGLPGGVGYGGAKEAINMLGLYMMYSLGILPEYKAPDPVRTLTSASGSIGIPITAAGGVKQHVESSLKSAENQGLLNTGIGKTKKKKKRTFK